MNEFIFIPFHSLAPSTTYRILAITKTYIPPQTTGGRITLLLKHLNTLPFITHIPLTCCPLGDADVDVINFCAHRNVSRPPYFVKKDNTSIACVEIYWKCI